MKSAIHLPLERPVTRAGEARREARWAESAAWSALGLAEAAVAASRGRGSRR